MGDSIIEIFLFPRVLSDYFSSSNGMFDFIWSSKIFIFVYFAILHLICWLDPYVGKLVLAKTKNFVGKFKMLGMSENKKKGNFIFLSLFLLIFLCFFFAKGTKLVSVFSKK